MNLCKKKNTKTVTIKIDSLMVEKFRDICKKNNIKQTAVLELAIMQIVEQYGEKNGK